MLGSNDRPKRATGLPDPLRLRALLQSSAHPGTPPPIRTSRSVDLAMPNRRASALTEAPVRTPWTSASRSTDASGRPILAPRRFAARIPAAVRSRIRSRSNSAMLPSTWKRSRPAGVLVSIAWSSTTRSIPSASSSRPSVVRWWTLRAILSSLVTASTSNRRRLACGSQRPREKRSFSQKPPRTARIWLEPILLAGEVLPSLKDTAQALLPPTDVDEEDQ